MPETQARPDWIPGHGELASLVRAKDWSLTPLGGIESWPQSLRTTVSLCLASNFPINIIWGAAHTQIYNDGYRVLCGEVHPQALGQAYTETWASAWPAIGEPFARALRGETSFLENQRMFLFRNGYLEETCFTFSISPIRDESGGIGGLFLPITETTTTMLATRRARALRNLNEALGTIRTTDEAFAAAAKTLQAHTLDLPFVLIYRLAADATSYELAGSCGVPMGSPLAPAGLPLDAAAPWPVAALCLSSGACQVDELGKLAGTGQVGPYEEPPHAALAFALRAPHDELPMAVMVAGTSPRLPLDESYRGFFDLLAAALAAGLITARAFEEAREHRESLVALDNAKTAFFSNVSHEFRTPLSLLLGPLDAVLADPAHTLTGEQRQQLALAQRNAKRVLKLVNSLLDYTTVEAAKATARFVPTDIVALTTDLASGFRAAIEGAGLRLTVALDPVGEPVYLDRSMWEKIVLNLLSNAFKFTLVGEIKLTLIRRDQAIEFAVCDTGSGITKQELPRVFERFHRVQGSEGRSIEGSGIGLALLQELAKTHGGAVRAESVIGQGSTFTVSIPLGSAHLPPDKVSQTPGEATGADAMLLDSFVNESLRWLPDGPDGPEAPEVPGEAEVSEHVESRAGRARILLADDNGDMRAYIYKLLSRRYDVTRVSNGQEACEAIVARRPDLVIADVMMPKVNGIALLRVLRQDPELQTLPVILLSARAGDDDISAGIELGANDYMIKPFSARELLARVETQLRLEGNRQRVLALALSRAQVAEQDRLRASIAALEEADQRKEEFLGVLSHELRTPINAIMGFGSVLKDEVAGPLDEEQQRYTGKILESADNLLALVDDLLVASRVQAGSFSVDLRAIQLPALAEMAIATLAPLAEQAGLTVLDEVPIDLPTIHADPQRIQQVLFNLVGNALKFTPRGGTVTVRAKVTGAMLRCEVADTGPGISIENQPKVFKRFSQLDMSTTRLHGGVGLGLSIVKAIALAHGGDAGVDSTPGEGATFWFSLPIEAP